MESEKQGQVFSTVLVAKILTVWTVPQNSKFATNVHWDLELRMTFVSNAIKTHAFNALKITQNVQHVFLVIIMIISFVLNATLDALSVICKVKAQELLSKLARTVLGNFSYKVNNV